MRVGVVGSIARLVRRYVSTHAQLCRQVAELEAVADLWLDQYRRQRDANIRMMADAQVFAARSGGESGEGDAIKPYPRYARDVDDEHAGGLVMDEDDWPDPRRAAVYAAAEAEAAVRRAAEDAARRSGLGHFEGRARISADEVGVPLKRRRKS